MINMHLISHEAMPEIIDQITQGQIMFAENRSAHDWTQTVFGYPTEQQKGFSVGQLLMKIKEEFTLLQLLKIEEEYHYSLQKFPSLDVNTLLKESIGFANELPLSDLQKEDVVVFLCKDLYNVIKNDFEGEKVTPVRKPDKSDALKLSIDVIDSEFTMLLAEEYILELFSKYK